MAANTGIGTESVRMERFHLVQKLDSFLYTIGCAFKGLWVQFWTHLPDEGRPPPAVSTSCPHRMRTLCRYQVTPVALLDRYNTVTTSPHEVCQPLPRGGR